MVGQHALAVSDCCFDTLITVKASPPWLLRQGSACAPPTSSGWLVTAQAVPRLWWIDAVARRLHADVFSPITATPIDPNPSEKPAQRLGSHRNVPDRIRLEPTARPSDMAFQTSNKRNCRYHAIWRSITAAGLIWPWLAALRFSSSDCCGLLNDLVKKHI